MSSPAAESNSRIASAVLRERDAARRQLEAAWQLQVFRVEEALVAGWQEQVGRVFEERFAELTARVQAEFAAAARHGADELNRALRRIAACQTRDQWAAALADSVAAACSRAALFAVEPPALAPLRPPGPAIPIEDAPSIAAAIASRDTVVTAATAAQLSTPIAALFKAGRCTVLPILARDRVAAVLVAAGDPLDLARLEAMAAFASAALERRRATPAPEIPEGAIDEALLLRAQRFARVRVAEIRLARSIQVVEGRATRRLYALLKEEIDAARAGYAREVLQASPFMPDYFHEEVVRVLANEDPAVLGDDYPGPLA
jgi:hypothetical protein